jgi:hypothetical protein
MFVVGSATAILDLITSVPEIKVSSLAHYGAVGIRILAVAFLDLPTFVLI